MSGILEKIAATLFCLWALSPAAYAGMGPKCAETFAGSTARGFSAVDFKQNVSRIQRSVVLSLPYIEDSTQGVSPTLAEAEKMAAFCQRTQSTPEQVASWFQSISETLNLRNGSRVSVQTVAEGIKLLEEASGRGISPPDYALELRNIQSSVVVTLPYIGRSTQGVSPTLTEAMRISALCQRTHATPEQVASWFNSISERLNLRNGARMSVPTVADGIKLLEDAAQRRLFP